MRPKQVTRAALTALATVCLALCSTAQAQSPTAPVTTLAAVNATTAAVNAAPAIDLRVSYHSRSVGVDGVQRDTRYANLMSRRPGRVWLERDIPANVRESLAHGHEHAHGPHAGHAHDEAQGAPLMVDRDASGRETVQVVLARTRRVIEVDRAHHGNVGYGGSWDAAYWLVTPASLSRMKAEGSPRGGVQRYVAKQEEQVTTIDWDVAGQFPRRVERRDAHGASYYLMTATRTAAPAVAPWKPSEGFGRGDYSDLLD